MKSRLLNSADGQTYAIVFETGDEAVGGLMVFAKEHGIEGAHFTAIGAFSDVVLAYFDWQAKEYQRIPIAQQVEVLSLAGDIAAAI